MFLNLLVTIETSLGNEITWLSNPNLLYKDSSIEKYIIGWYWAATILSSVGFGDITPANSI